jgi:photosystem II stability/assembly factor-like uncharacterized protein
MVLLFSGLGCNVTSQDEQQISFDGEFTSQAMQDQVVHKLTVYNNQLFAGTSQGLASFNISTSLEYSGSFLQESTVPTFAIISDDNWLISADFEGDTASSSIYRSTNRGNTWIEYNNDFGANHKVIPHTMDVRVDTTSTIFARPAALTVVAKSTDAGQSWETVVQSWENPNFGTSSFVKIDPNHPRNIWAGGATAYFRPNLLKSEDNGESWTGILVIEKVETTVFDVASHPSNNDIVLAGLGIGIRKTTDGGQNWGTSFQQAGIHSFTHSADNPEIVYASGRNSAGTLFFVASGDFGNSWETIEMPDSPAGMQVNDMVSVMVDGQEVLYFGTNKGVYSYRFEE